MKLRATLAAATCGLLLLSGCSAAPSSSADGDGSPSSITIASWGGRYAEAMRSAFFDPYTADSGVNVVDADAAIASLQTQVDTGNVEWDAITISTTDLGLGSAKGLFENLDGVVDPADFIDGTVTDYAVGLDFSSNVLAWSTDEFGEGAGAPSSWEDFWDLEKFPGKRAVPSWGPDAQLFEFALLADGVDKDDLYPLDIDRALAKLGEIRDSFIVYDSNAQGLQLVSSGQASLGVLPSGVEYEGRSFTYNGAALATDWIAIPKGAPHAETAKEFIRFATQVPQQQAFSDELNYAGTNAQALEGLDADTVANLPTGEEAMAVQFRPDPDYYAENATSMMEAWQKFLYN
ncbi:extracellular solute-binding protein [Leucobacter chromiiresistens]|nr:extracellular solute-binding protein [Leucobacter chromiiresistens]